MCRRLYNKWGGWLPTWTEQYVLVFTIGLPPYGIFNKSKIDRQKYSFRPERRAYNREARYHLARRELHLWRAFTPDCRRGQWRASTRNYRRGGWSTSQEYFRPKKRLFRKQGRLLPSKAGTTAMTGVHTGIPPRGVINQSRILTARKAVIYKERPVIT